MNSKDMAVKEVKNGRLAMVRGFAAAATDTTARHRAGPPPRLAQRPRRSRARLRLTRGPRAAPRLASPPPGRVHRLCGAGARDPHHAPGGPRRAPGQPWRPQHHLVSRPAQPQREGGGVGRRGRMPDARARVLHHKRGPKRSHMICNRRHPHVPRPSPPRSYLTHIPETLAGSA